MRSISWKSMITGAKKISKVVYTSCFFMAIVYIGCALVYIYTFMKNLNIQIKINEENKIFFF